MIAGDSILRQLLSLRHGEPRSIEVAAERQLWISERPVAESELSGPRPSCLNSWQARGALAEARTKLAVQRRGRVIVGMRGLELNVLKRYAKVSGESIAARVPNSRPWRG